MTANTYSTAPRSPLSRIRVLLPGVMLCGVIGLAATFVSEHYGGPQFLYALLIGIAFHFLTENPKCLPGIEVSAKKLVRIGVALLGVRIAASDVGDLGLAGVAALVGTVVLTISFGVLLARALKLPPMLGLLSGGGTGICGISATLAISSTLPQTADNERYTLLTAIGIATFSTLAMVLYPLIVTHLGLSRHEAGLFLGGSIHDVSQVVGAGYIISAQVADAATLAKMFRVAMLMPVVMVLALAFHARRTQSAGAGSERAPLIPMFLLVFAGLVLINSLGGIPSAVASVCSEVSRWCLVVSIAALGVKTSFQKLADLGWKPIVLLAGEAAFVAIYMLVAVYLMRSLG